MSVKTNRTYNELKKRCTELGLKPCVGKRDEIEKKVLAEEARLEALEEEKRERERQRGRTLQESETLPLPEEIIQYEIAKRLDIGDLLSYCESNLAARSLCDRRRLLEDRLQGDDYTTLQHNVEQWFWSGLQIEKLLRVLGPILDKVNLYTLQLGYLYLLEQNKADLAKQLNQLVITSKRHGKQAADDDRAWFSQTVESYIPLRELLADLRAVPRNNNRIFNTFSRCCKDFDLQTNVTSSRYLAGLLVNALTPAERQILLEALDVFSSSISTTMRETIISLCYLLKIDGLLPFYLSTLLVSICRGVRNGSLRIYTPVELNLTGREYRDRVADPLTKRGVAEYLKTGRIPHTITFHYSPVELTSYIKSRQPNRRKTLISSLNDRARTIIASGYNVWIEEVLSLLMKEPFADEDIAVKRVREEIGVTISASYEDKTA